MQVMEWIVDMRIVNEQYLRFVNLVMDAPDTQPNLARRAILAIIRLSGHDTSRFSPRLQALEQAVWYARTHARRLETLIRGPGWGNCRRTFAFDCLCDHDFYLHVQQNGWGTLTLQNLKFNARRTAVTRWSVRKMAMNRAF